MKQNVALFINPSYDTPIQTSFVDNLKKTINDIGWLAVTLCNRRTLKDQNTIFIEKQRLTDYKERVFSDFPVWLPEEVIKSYVEQELDFRKGNQERDSACIRNGLLYCSNIIDMTFQKLKPSITFLENKVYFFTSMGWLAAKHYGSKTYLTEKSPLMNIWVEDEGFFSETGLAKSFAKRVVGDDDYYKALGSIVAKDQHGKAQGFRNIDYAVNLTKDFLDTAKKPIIFLPFDNANGTALNIEGHPQKKQDYKSLTTKSIIEKAIAAADKVNGALVIKSHPSYKLSDYYPEYADYFYESFDIDLMLQRADLVVGMLSKTLFHALLYKKQVVSIADSAVSYAGFTHIADEAGDWGQVFERALKTARENPPEVENVRLGNVTYDYYLIFLGWAYTNFFYDQSNYPNFGRKNVYTLTNSFPQYEKSPLNMLTLENEIQSLQRIVGALPAPAMKRLIYFDVSRLRNKAFKHTGISAFMQSFLESFGQLEGTKIAPALSNSKLNKNNDYATHQEFEAALGTKVVSLPLSQPDHKNYEQVIYFSPQDALPPPSATPNHMRVLCINDIFLYNTSGYPTSIPARENFRCIIQSIDPKRDFVVCISEYTKKALLDMFPFINEEHVICVDIFVGERFFTPSEEILTNLLPANNLKRDDYIVLLYQQNQRKNWNTIFNVLGKMVFKKKYSGKIVFVCNQATREHLLPLLQEFFLEDLSQIHFVISPSDDELSALYSGAAFTIYPSLYEGFGLPVVEAMASGCPVLAHDGSSVKEVAEGAGALVDMTSASEIEAAVEKLISSPELRAELKVRGLERAQKFTRQQIINNYEKAFDCFWLKYQIASKVYRTIKPYTEAAKPGAATPTAQPAAKPAKPAQPAVAQNKSNRKLKKFMKNPYLYFADAKGAAKHFKHFFFLWR